MVFGFRKSATSFAEAIIHDTMSQIRENARIFVSIIQTVSECPTEMVEFTTMYAMFALMTFWFQTTVVLIFIGNQVMIIRYHDHQTQPSIYTHKYNY